MHPLITLLPKAIGHYCTSEKDGKRKVNGRRTSTLTLLIICVTVVALAVFAPEQFNRLVDGFMFLVGDTEVSGS